MIDDPLDDARFEAYLRDAARTYNPPPSDLDADTDAMWSAIEQALPADAPPALTIVPPSHRRKSVWTNPWLRMAAVLLVGVAIGRLSTRLATPAGAGPDRVATVPTTPEPATTVALAADVALPLPEQIATNDYLGRTEALLAALPAELRARRADPAYISRADALLLQTRLLLDSPAAADPALRSLFDDLEIVLAQVVRLQRADRDPTRIDFLQQALEQRDVVSRLRDAVADKATAD